MRAPFAILALMLLMAALWAQSNPAGPSGLPLVNQRDIFVPNWLSLSMVALALSIGLIALLFMAGEAFNLPNVRSFARQEVYALAVSVLLIVLVLSGLYAYGQFAERVTSSSLVPGTPIVSGFCNDSLSIYPVNSSNPENKLYADVDWFLGCMPTGEHGKYELLNESVALPYNASAVSPYSAAQWKDGSSKGVMVGHLMNIYIGLFTLELPLGTISTFGVSAYLPEPLVSSISLDFAPHAALSPISEATITITDLIGVGVSTLIMQKILLQFIHQNAIAVFLPLGLGFRAIPFLRKTGSTIIALTLALYFVFPLTIWINQQVYFGLQGGIVNGQYQHPVISDWTNYHTLLQACVPQTPAERENPQLVIDRVQRDIAQPYAANASDVEKALREKIYGSAKNAQGQTVSIYMPTSQANALIEALKNNGQLVTTYLLHPAFALGPSLPVDFFYSALVDQITVGAQWFALNLLFLVNTLIITITLFRDISLAIGGEPRIFGMSKLV
ncbi:Uncharacterised protein [uncultured archaeon]|nr:Uncharacterised protein [uncultured archaeon]